MDNLKPIFFQPVCTLELSGLLGLFSGSWLKHFSQGVELSGLASLLAERGKDNLCSFLKEISESQMSFFSLFEA